MEVNYDVNEQDNRQSTSYDALGTTMMTGTGWEQNLLHDSSMFYTDQFPQIIDFPCMSASSSSSSSSNPAPATTTSTASSMSSSTIDCMDVMESYGYMDLIDDCNDSWDPSSLFDQNPPPELLPESEVVVGSEVNNGGGGELGSVFFEWLKSNKELISVEDMRKIKIKKSTVETASKRLGSSNEGKKQLLKLILQWVQHHQLQRKNSSGGTAATVCPPPPAPPPFNYGFSAMPWVPPHPSCHTDQVGSNGMVVASVMPPPCAFCYMGGGYVSGLNNHLNPYNKTGSGDCQVLKSRPSWNHGQMATTVSGINNMCNNYPGQFWYNPMVHVVDGGDERRLTGLGSAATKKARKKRMARQRRTYFHHSRQNQNHVANSDQYHPQAMVVDDNCSGKSHGGNWLYWPSPPSTTTVPLPTMEAPHRPASGYHLSVDQLQGLKTDQKNLKFLLQKVLKQSDVGSLGRIVMPKKEAECHLPDLTSRDGITIAMEDIGTSQVWNMRYRFWPNNKSRMYLLENAGDFVKANGLQEGDFIVLYSNVKCDKYLIRGVKVRHPASGKSKTKKPVKRSYRSIS